LAVLEPADLQTDDDRVTWEMITAAERGDVTSLRTLLDARPALVTGGYFYTPIMHFAVREGHASAVELLLARGADPEQNGFYGVSLAEMAMERGHDSIAVRLEAERSRRGQAVQTTSPVNHPIHEAAEAGDASHVAALLDADPALVHRTDEAGGTPLHRAVIGRSRRVVSLLLDRGADIHAVHGVRLQTTAGHCQPIDLAVWGGPRRVRPSAWRLASGTVRMVWKSWHPTRRQPCDVTIASLLLARGATYDVTIAAALGDQEAVTRLLDAEPLRIQDVPSNGRRPLSAATEFGHESIVHVLLERGADPRWPEGGSSRGASLHYASASGNLALVKELLAHGADPNSDVDSAGNATFVAKTPEIRALLMSRGGVIDPYDLVWLDQDDEVMRAVTADPASALRGCGGVFTAVVTRGKRDLLRRLLDAGIRVPPVVTGCQAYLLEQLDMLRTLLDSGMSPDLPNWQQQTLLHQACGGAGASDRDRLACVSMLLDAGATITARDDMYRSTPIGWAARQGQADVVRLLLARGAPVRVPDEEPWATPLAWATRRGHEQVAAVLRTAGAESGVRP
jgi:ankyrin repeat protein